MTRNSSRASQIVAAILICSSLTAFSGAWTPKKGEVYLKLAANEFNSHANYNIAGDVFDPFEDFDDRYSKFKDQNFQLYFEIGLLDKLALVGGLTYKDIQQRTKLPNLEVGADNDGFADVDLGLRYRLTEGPNVVSLALNLKLPYLYDDDDNFFQLGSAQEDIELRVLYGRSLGKGFYGGLEAAYRFRTDEPSDEYRYLSELGWSKNRFYARTKLEGIFATDDFQEGSTFGNPLLNPRYDLTTWLITAGFSINKHWHAEYTFADTISGKNTADGTNNQIAIVMTF